MMKKLTKGLLLITVCLPLVSFAEADCSHIDMSTISNQYKILKCANNGLYTYTNPTDENNTPKGFIDSVNPASPSTDEQGRLTPFEGGISQSLKQVNGIYKVGLVNTEGDLIVPHIYDMAFTTSQGNTIVAIGDFSGLNNVDNRAKWGVIDNKGKILVPIMYDTISTFGDAGVGFWVGKKTENNLIKYGFINLKGQVLVPVNYDKIELSDSKQFIKAFKNGLSYQLPIN